MNRRMFLKICLKAKQTLILKCAKRNSVNSIELF